MAPGGALGPDAQPARRPGPRRRRSPAHAPGAACRSRPPAAPPRRTGSYRSPASSAAPWPRRWSTSVGQRLELQPLDGLVLLLGQLVGHHESPRCGGCSHTCHPGLPRTTIQSRPSFFRRQGGRPRILIRKIGERPKGLIAVRLYWRWILHRSKGFPGGRKLLVQTKGRSLWPEKIAFTEQRGDGGLLVDAARWPRRTCGPRRCT